MISFIKEKKAFQIYLALWEGMKAEFNFTRHIQTWLLQSCWIKKKKHLN